MEMYKAEELCAFPFFREVLRETALSFVLDSLTGVVSREYTLDLIRDLISRNIPFAAGLIDLDNFKSYNDNYGHSVGDQVLSGTAASLKNYVGTRGLVGRFGGDEFLVVAVIGNDYDTVHQFYRDMFNQGDIYSRSCVFRRMVQVGHLRLFLTATVGCACFPKDAQDYDTLFSLMDKTLYRGKFKGRNCYIIYVPEKHADLEIPKLARHSLYDVFTEMAAGFDRGSDRTDRLRRAFEPLRLHQHLQYLMLLTPDGRMTNGVTGLPVGQCESPLPLLNNGCFACSSRQELASLPRLSGILESLSLHSILIVAVGDPHAPDEYLLLSPEPGTLHIWQDEELASGFLLARLIAGLA